MTRDEVYKLRCQAEDEMARCFSIAVLSVISHRDHRIDRLYMEDFTKAITLSIKYRKMQEEDDG